MGGKYLKILTVLGPKTLETDAWPPDSNTDGSAVVCAPLPAPSKIFPRKSHNFATIPSLPIDSTAIIVAGRVFFLDKNDALANDGSLLQRHVSIDL